MRIYHSKDRVNITLSKDEYHKSKNEIKTLKAEVIRLKKEILFLNNELTKEIILSTEKSKELSNIYDLLYQKERARQCL